jgi:hydroxymethylbilane synthase
VARVLTIGTRGSRLALAQAEEVQRRLAAISPGRQFILKIIVTHGDRDQRRPLPSMGEVGLFTKELERALDDGAIDLAVHSLKDLPTTLAEGLALDVVTPRADPRDALVTRDGATLADLPAGATVGTSSARRAAQVLALRPDLVPRPIRGNVETRLAKVPRGEYDGCVVAAAGLARLGLAAQVSEVFEPDRLTPAPGQGVLAVECRMADAEAASLLREARHDRAYRAGAVERAVLRSLGGGCRAPIGVLAEPTGPDRLRVTALVAAPDGSRLVRLVREGAGELETLAADISTALREAGADELIRQGYRA